MENRHPTEATTLRRINRLLHHLLYAEPISNRLLHPSFLGGKEIKQVNEMPVIIGGMVLDIHATASIPSSSKSTTPGKVDYMLGGVARNIAECLLKLGTKPYMISAVGNDMAGDQLLELWESVGLPIEGVRRGTGIKTAVVCNMFDIGGELTSGVASVESIERYVTPQWIRQFKSIVCSAPVMLVDANLSPRALEASCQMAADFDVPVWFEPVSVAKSKRIASVANYPLYHYKIGIRSAYILPSSAPTLVELYWITFASPNEHELVAMANALSHKTPFCPFQEDQDKARGSTGSLFLELKPAIIVLLEKGIKFVLVTLGSNGALLCSRSGPSCLKECLDGRKPFGGGKELFDMVSSGCPTQQYTHSTPDRGSSHLFAMHFTALPATVRRVSGAGDCVVGGVLAALSTGLNVMQSMAVGIAAAKAALEVETNVPHTYDMATIADDAVAVYRAAKVVFEESISLAF